MSGDSRTAPLSGMQLDRLTAVDCTKPIDLATLKHVSITWPIFDGSTVVNIENLTLSGSDKMNLSIIKCMENLSVLTIEGSEKDQADVLTRCPPLGSRKLSRVILKNNAIADVSPFYGVVVTEELDLSGNPIVDISPLAHVPVEKLNLANTMVTDLTPLKTLYTLKWLDITGLRLSGESLQFVEANKHRIRFITAEWPVIPQGDCTIYADCQLPENAINEAFFIKPFSMKLGFPDCYVSR